VAIVNVNKWRLAIMCAIHVGLHATELDHGCTIQCVHAHPMISNYDSFALVTKRHSSECSAVACIPCSRLFII